MSDIKATVFIPTYNGEKYIKDILYMLFEQQLAEPFEILVIDSGSTDKTVSIVESFLGKHDNLRLEHISNKEFGHGKTRNLAARKAKGEFIVYLSHDAIPAHDKWLYEMLKPFELHEKIVAVMGKQDPRPGCFPLMKYDIQHIFASFGPDLGTTLYYKDDFITNQGMRDFVRFYSDVNSATRREFLLNEIPYRDVPYAEDMLFGEDIINAGYLKAYASRGNVWHSNDMELGEYKARMFDETVGLRRDNPDFQPLGLKGAVKNAVVGGFKDEIRIVLDGSYTWKRKLYWLAVNPLFHIERNRGMYLAGQVDLSDDVAVERHSLEGQRKRQD